jgi:hypothetical protein
MNGRPNSVKAKPNSVSRVVLVRRGPRSSGWTAQTNRRAIASMPSYSKPRRYRSDNIARLLPRERADKLGTVLGILRARSGAWLDRDPDKVESWWQDVLRDSRAQRTRMENIPADHPDACLRLDRCKALAITVR